MGSLLQLALALLGLYRGGGAGFGDEPTLAAHGYWVEIIGRSGE